MLNRYSSSIYVSNGSALTIADTPLGLLLTEALLAIKRQRSTVPITSLVPTTVPPIVVCNAEGFFSLTPLVDVVLLNATTYRLTLRKVDQYWINVEEGLQMYTTPQALPGSYLPPSLDLTPLLIRVGTLLVTPDASGELPATVGVVVGVGVGGVVLPGGSAAQLQGVGALTMIGCSDPLSTSRFSSYRILSSVAVLNSYEGVIIGNVVSKG